MDVTVRIEEVIAAKGLTKSKVAERMGKFNQAFNRLITNPKWETIELVAQSIGITTEELLFGKLHEANDNNVEGKFLLSNIKDNAYTDGMLICPHCSKGIRLSVIETD